MNLASKAFLAAAAAGLGVGAWVSLTSVKLHPIWTLALPLGAISLGMFFLTWFMQEPAARFDEEQRNIPQSPESHSSTVPEAGGGHPGPVNVATRKGIKSVHPG